MPRPKKGPRLYARQQGGMLRYYADLRSIGGGREALIPPGETLATTDPTIAHTLLSRRVVELEAGRRSKHILGISREETLRSFVAHHLIKKAKAGKVTADWLAQTQKKLERAIEHFGTDRPLDSIGVSDVQRYAEWLGEQTSGKVSGARLRPGTVRHYLNVLSNVYQRAQSEGVVPLGYNPVAALVEKPTPAREEAAWLEVWEGALLLESARSYRPQEVDGFPAVPFVYPLLATFLLTGGRESEVFGLALEDVSFDRRTVTFRPHPWRRLKTLTSHRTVPLWPQLEDTLRPYVFGGDGPKTGLLFPSVRTGGLLTDIRKPLDRVAERAGWKAGEVRTKAFRHTYTAARLQTLDKGAPISPWTVARELGHGGRSLVDRVYGHLGDVRHRSEVVEYRISQHRERSEVRERLERLLAG
ncbi:MAG TPA: site-specific integrase [Longimicrobiaceae bacterium]|nr:site-specific integrase [Longimicrobiaceae bacterium]